MGRVLVLVEGDTEEQFVKSILAPHLTQHGTFIIPTIVTTKRLPGKPHFKGGVSSYGKIRNDIRRLCRDSNAVCMTTMLDLYHLPDDFPGLKEKSQRSPQDRVQYLEQEFSKDIGDDRFLPYLSLHEFEALLFADIDQIAAQFPELESVSKKLRQAKSKFGSPEEIDDRQPPSKRIEKVIPQYQKPRDGRLICQAIGLARIRAECPHFNQWVEQLESIGTSQ